MPFRIEGAKAGVDCIGKLRKPLGTRASPPAERLTWERRRPRLLKQRISSHVPYFHVAFYPHY